MIESGSEGYLDKLVIKYIVQNIGLELIEFAEEQERPKIFLDSLGWGQKKGYIEDTLNSYLSGLLQTGDVYVFTPDDSFKYQIDERGAQSVGIRERRDSKSTFNDALNDIITKAKEKKAAKQSATANVLFFDQASKGKFGKRLNLISMDERLGTGGYSVEPHQLSVYKQQEGKQKEKLFDVTLFKYTIK